MERVSVISDGNRKYLYSLVLAVVLGAAIGVVVGHVEAYLLLALPVGLLAAALTFLNPEQGLLIFVFITYIRLSDILVNNYGLPSLARAIILLLGMSILGRWVVLKEIPTGWLRPALMVAAYGMIVFGSLFYADDFSRAMEAASDFWKDGLIAVLMVLLIQDRGTFRRVIWVLIAAGILLGGISVHQYLTGNFSTDYLGFAEAPLLNITSGTEGRRISGPLGDPNYYAQIMVFLFPLALNRFLFESSRALRLLAGFASLVIGMTVVFTFSRGGAVALLIALMAMVVYHPPRLKYSILIVLALYAVFLMLPPTYTQRLGTLTDLVGSEEASAAEVSFRGRVSEVMSAWYMFRDHPILGVGVRNYPVLYQEYSREIGLDPRAEARQPHNLYLEVAAETGLLGLLVFGFILFSVFRSVQRARTTLQEEGEKDLRRLVEAFSSGLIGYLGAAMFIHGAYPRYFWLLAGIALSLPQAISADKRVE